MKSVGTRVDGARLERIKASPLWANDRFQNLHPIPPNLRDSSVPMPSIKDFMFGGEAHAAGTAALDEPAQQLDQEAAKRPAHHLARALHDVDRDRRRARSHRPRVGTACLAVRARRAETISAGAVTLREMPPVDVVVISHDHYDHLDYPTIRALAKTSVPFVTSLGVGAHLEYWGVQPERITELDWWESWRVPNSDVALMLGGVFMPVHWATVALAMHAWDQPAERLMELAPRSGAQLVMPLLGQPVEPAHAESVEPWWRAVANSAIAPASGPGDAITLPASAEWPLD